MRWLTQIGEVGRTWLHQQLDDLLDYSKPSWTPLFLAILGLWLLGLFCLWLREPIQFIYDPTAPPF